MLEVNKEFGYLRQKVVKVKMMLLKYVLEFQVQHKSTVRRIDTYFG